MRYETYKSYHQVSMCSRLQSAAGCSNNSFEGEAEGSCQIEPMSYISCCDNFGDSLLAKRIKTISASN